MKLKTVRIIYYALLGLFWVLMFLMALTQASVFGYLAIAAVLVCGGFNVVLWRCPGCGKCLGRVGKWRFCPHCGAKVDF